MRLVNLLHVGYLMLNHFSVPCMCQFAMSCCAYGKCTASELANAFCSCIYCALEVNVGPLAPNCGCAGYFARSPAYGKACFEAALQCLARGRYALKVISH